MKREAQEGIAKSKMEQLDKLQRDLGHGESFAMETNQHRAGDEKKTNGTGSLNPEICVGGRQDNFKMKDERGSDEEEAEERQELESFQRFLAREREKSLETEQQR